MMEKLMIGVVYEKIPGNVSRFPLVCFWSHHRMRTVAAHLNDTEED